MPNKTNTRVPKWDKKEVERSGLKASVEQIGHDVEIIKAGGRVQDFMPERTYQ